MCDTQQQHENFTLYSVQEQQMANIINEDDDLDYGETLRYIALEDNS